MVQVEYKNLDNWRIIRSSGDHSLLFYSLIFLIFPLIFVSIFSFHFKLIETFFLLLTSYAFLSESHFFFSPPIENILLLRAYKSISFKGHLDNKDAHFQKSPSAPPASWRPLWMCNLCWYECVGVWQISHIKTRSNSNNFIHFEKKKKFRNVLE